MKNTKEETPKTIKVISGVKNPNKKKHFAMPVSVLQQLNEFSNGGYYLISFTENGHPVISCRADNGAYMEALKKFCVDYFRCLSKAEKRVMQQTVFHSVISDSFRPPNSDSDEPPHPVSA